MFTRVEEERKKLKKKEKGRIRFCDEVKGCGVQKLGGEGDLNFIEGS